MKWRKLGQVFSPQEQWPWMKSHASNPVADFLGGDVYRIYFSSRDKDNRSSICSLDWNVVKLQILEVHSRPVISPGELGLFDDSGTSMGCLVHLKDRSYLYYLGWNLGVTVPWRTSIGLAVRSHTNAFIKHSPAPLLDRSHSDPYSLSYPWILKEKTLWRMWYGSNLNWGARQQDMAHLIKYAESSDGLNWQREGHVALPFASDDEYAMSKPCVIHENGLYRMWYSFRGHAYRIGYAESEDAKQWTRMDHLAGISVSDHGWDSETIEYPFVFNHKENRYMLYNGNGYGITGFGIAVLEQDHI